MRTPWQGDRIGGVGGVPPANAGSTAGLGRRAGSRHSLSEATIFGNPLNGMYQRLSEETPDPATRKAGFNAYFHYADLATPVERVNCTDFPTEPI